MPLNKSTTYHQSVQFYVQVFFKKSCLFTEKFFFSKFFLKFFLIQFYLKSTQFYHILLSFTSSGTQFYQIRVYKYQTTTTFVVAIVVDGYRISSSNSIIENMLVRRFHPFGPYMNAAIMNEALCTLTRWVSDENSHIC